MKFLYFLLIIMFLSYPASASEYIIYPNSDTWISTEVIHVNPFYPDEKTFEKINNTIKSEYKNPRIIAIVKNIKIIDRTPSIKVYDGQSVTLSVSEKITHSEAEKHVKHTEHKFGGSIRAYLFFSIPILKQIRATTEYSYSFGTSDAYTIIDSLEKSCSMEISVKPQRCSPFVKISEITDVKIIELDIKNKDKKWIHTKIGVFEEPHLQLVSENEEQKTFRLIDVLEAM